MIYLIIVLITSLAGLVQGVTGFGSCIVIMMVLPHYFPLAQAAGIAVSSTLIMGIIMILRYRKNILVKQALLPSVLYLMVTSLVIHYSAAMDPRIMKKALGVFLILLSEYYLGFAKSDQNHKMPLIIAVFCIVISATCDGLFGIGGPLMVLYFLSRTKNLHEYLGTLQLFFLVNNVYNTSFRFYKGILKPEHLIFIAVGMVGIFLGTMVAGKIVDKVKTTVLRKLVYGMIGISGIINLL